LIKDTKKKEKQDNVRMMLPFSVKCNLCGNYLYVGTKFNMRKETCKESYLGIKQFRFYMKCTYCYSEVAIKTDPKNHDYSCEQGASRNYEAWRDARAAEHKLKELREDEE
jgi:Saf4/Yju2 protein